MEEQHASASEEASETVELRASDERYKLFAEDFLSFLFPLSGEAIREPYYEGYSGRGQEKDIYLLNPPLRGLRRAAVMIHESCI